MESMESMKSKISDVSVVHQGHEISLPVISGKPMSNKEAINWLERKEEQETKIIDIHHEIKCQPLDGLVAFQKAVYALYGWTDMVKIPPESFFDNEHPPKLIGVDTGDGNTLQVHLGRIKIPGIDGWVQTAVSVFPSPGLTISGRTRHKQEAEINEIVAKTRHYLKEESIYKGKAVKISFKWIEDMNRGIKPYQPVDDAPHFMDLGGLSESDLIFGADTLDALNVGLFTPIEFSEACRTTGVPLKRGVLLYGPYGTGKTLTANVTALKAIKNGWTFIYLDDVSYLKEALDFARQYAPAVLFAEDIDRVMTGERSVEMDEILNTLDGVDTKGAEIITVFSTNHVENINPATLRMGRLDSLIHVAPPDKEAAEALIRLYGRGMIPDSLPLMDVAQALEGAIPAFIREVVERAKIAAIGRTGGPDIKGKVLAGDLLKAANAMKPHADMLLARTKTLDVSKYQFLLPGNSLQDIEVLTTSSNGASK